MYKNILLHGATNCKSSNYGDFIYGKMIYDFFNNKNYNVYFYQPSEFFKKNLKDYDNKKFYKKEADLIVYIPGGYFGEGHKAKIKENLVQFLRFMPLGIWASYRRIPMVVLGIGAGPINNALMKFGIKRICNNSSFVTVRDNESYKTLKSLCPKANIIECGDLILTSNIEKTSTNTKQLKEIIEMKKDKKIILVHYNHDKYALNRFAESLNNFVRGNKDYSVVVASDSILEYDNEYYDLFKKKFKYESKHFIYQNPYEMTSLLEQMNIVLTCKLHVGVIAASYGKSVIAAACHPEKTKRFYEQIGEAERCVSLYELGNEQLVSLLEKYKDKKIKIENTLICNANKSWKILEEFMENKNEK